MTMTIPSTPSVAVAGSTEGHHGSTSPSIVPTLPGPSELVDSTQDTLAQLYACLVAFQKEQTVTAQSDVKTNDAARKNAERQREAELAKAKREAEKGGLFKWISDDIGLLGVVGLATFNYGLVAADLALHKTELVDNLKLDLVDAAVFAYGRPEIMVADVLLRKLDIAPDEVKQKLDELGLGESVPGISDEDVKPAVDKVLAANLMIASSVASVLTAGSTTALVVACIGIALSTAGTATQWAGGPEELAFGLQLAGAGCSIASAFMGGGAATAASKAGTTAKTGGAAAASTSKTAQMGARAVAAKTAAKIVNGTSAALNGVDTLVRSVHEKAGDDANERATAARHALARLERLLDDIIDGLRESQESFKRTTSIVQSTLQTHNQTLVLAASALKG